MDRYIVVKDGNYEAAFAIDERGELLETVDRLEDGSWDWDAAGICDPRGENPALQATVRASLETLAVNDPLLRARRALDRLASVEIS